MFSGEQIMEANEENDTMERHRSRVVRTPSPRSEQEVSPRSSRARDRCSARRSRGKRSRSRHSRGRPSRASTRSRSPILRQRPTNIRYENERRKELSRSPPRVSAQRNMLHHNMTSDRRHNSVHRDRFEPYQRAGTSQQSQHLSHESNTQRAKADFVSLNTPSINLNDFMNFMSSFVKSEHSQKLHYDKNMIPEFDPTIKNHRIETWISKVNECSQIYGWSDQQTSHFALPRLVGHAKKWYEGLSTINRTWSEWQQCLKRAFPSESNYGVLLSDMLERRYRSGESLDEYYYDKMVLLSACDISGKKAVDCVIHGLDDKTIRASASSARFTQPEDLLSFLKDMCREKNDYFRSSKPKQSSIQSSSNITCTLCKKTGHYSKQCRAIICYNCKQVGHRISGCQQPLIKCETCQKVGHKTEDCYFKNKDKASTEKRVMAVDTTEHIDSSKYYKKCTINGKDNEVSCFIDFGSDCSLIRSDLVDSYGLTYERGDSPIIKGVGESKLIPLGRTRFTLCIGSVKALIDAYVVQPEHLHVPILVGQNYTEQPHILVIKSHKKLEILNRDIGAELPAIENEPHVTVKLFISDDTVVNKSGAITCYTSNVTNGTLYVPGSYRFYTGCELWVQEGIYSVKDSKTSILVVTPFENVTLKKDSLLIRACIVNECLTESKENSQLSCFRVQTHYEPIARTDVNINPELSLEEQDKVFHLITNYRPTFAQNLSELGCTGLTEMEIQLNDKNPVVYKPYRLSYSERQDVQTMVSELIENDIVEESVSSYASPILLVAKKNGGKRLCVDYRALNSRTVKDHFPLPRIEDQIDQLSGSKYFTSLDLTSGYYQIPIKPDCRHLTAFVTPDGLYQFKRMPFGLVNAPSIFQRTITKALSAKIPNANFEQQEKQALAYMDDLIITSKNIQEGLEKLENTFKLLNNANLTLNVQKCFFFQTSIDYLGYEISYEGIRPGKSKIEAVENFPEPKNVHEVRQFIGLASYFRKFIKDFSIIARPLTELTRKTVTWKWSVDEQQAFETLKSKLVQRPVLALYNPQFKTELHTDASKIGLAGILLQKEHDSAPLKPIAFYSRKTTLDEQKFHAYDLETLAVVTSLNRFRVYLLGIEFTIVTDCNALRATFSKRDILPRIARWWLTLQEYDCIVIYRPNQSMTHVDALSRNPIGTNQLLIEPELPRVLNITRDDWLMSLQQTDPKLTHIRKVLEDPDYNDVVDIKQNFIIKDNKLFRKVGDELKWAVPKGARWQICQQNHDEIGHFSLDKTLSKIKKDFWFPKMKKFVSKYVKACVHCAYGKDTSGKKEGYLHPIPKIDIPFHTCHIDHLGPFVRSSRGNMYILLIVDGFTKFCILKPLRNLKSTLTIRALGDVFSTFGYPSRLISDRGTCFTSKEFEKFCADSKIKHILNAVASPRANGQVERYNRTVLGALCSYVDKVGETKWDQELGRVQWGLNNTLNKGTGKTPSEALFGRNLNYAGENAFSEIFHETRSQEPNIEETRIEITKHIENDQIKQKLRFDKHRKNPRKYNVGDLVKVKKQNNSSEGQSKKLLPVFSGPYKITKVYDNDRYEVSSIPGSNLGKRKYCNVWAVDQIQPWIGTRSDSITSSSDSELEV